MFWWRNKNGVYSVKSGYWLGLLGHQRESADATVEMDQTMWRVVWNFAGPPKLRHFLWSACKGSLATKWVLYQKYCVSSPLCDRCNGDEETILLALCDCPNISPMWAQHSAALLIQDAPRTSVIEFLLWLLNHASDEAFGSLCATLWAGWFIRNKYIFDAHVQQNGG